MQSHPLISVLVPACNHEAFIVQTLESIRNDDYPNKELIIINDGSTDKTGELIKAWLEKNDVDFETNYSCSENRGVTKTLNELVAASSGEYVLFIHSDDYLLPGGIKLRYEYMKQHPDKAAVFADCIVVDENDKQIFSSGLSELHTANKKKLQNSAGLVDEIITNWSVPGGTLMVRKSAYNEFRYNEDFIIEDLDFYLFFGSKSKIGFLDKQVSAYRVHGKNTSMKDMHWIKVQKDLIHSYQRNLKYFGFRHKLLIYHQIILKYIPLLRHHISKLLKSEKS